MFDGFNQGYTKALIDMQQFVDDLDGFDDMKRSTKKKMTAVQSLLKLLLSDSEKRDIFRTWGGYCWKKMTPNGEILTIANRKEDL